MQLTDLKIRNAKPRAKPYKLVDGRGLYLEVTPNNSRLWRWKYRFDGVEKLMALGKYPEVSLLEARDRHSDGRRVVRDGIDPMAQRKAKKIATKQSAADSFRTVAYLWHSHWMAGKSTRHVDVVKRRMEGDLFPLLASRPIRDVQSLELLAVVKKIEGRGVSDLAKRALETLNQIFRYAVLFGFRESNPAANLKPSEVLKPRKKVNLPRIDANELPDLLRAIEAYLGSHVTRFALKLMALTFVRTTELIGAKWSELDIESRRWKIPAERMKMRTPHIVPLSLQTVELLETLRLLTGHRDLLFPGDRDFSKPMSNNTLLMALKRMGYQGRMTGHGFRGLASTVLHEQGYPHEHIELQLAHAPRNAVSAAYNHANYLAPRAAMMQNWADFLDDTRRAGKLPAFKVTAA